ncbi:hypothetical protein CPC08DRAFT_708327 [Agrocybe pediades]|nr:hypothetical protein CPC08DRAFT_708327 [Agrocybe pediades]
MVAGLRHKVLCPYAWTDFALLLHGLSSHLKLSSGLSFSVRTGTYEPARFHPPGYAVFHLQSWRITALLDKLQLCLQGGVLYPPQREELLPIFLVSS